MVVWVLDASILLQFSDGGEPTVSQDAYCLGHPPMRWRFFVFKSRMPVAQVCNGLVEVKDEVDDLLVVHGCVGGYLVALSMAASAIEIE
jgi:hypothetical protein